MSKYAILRKGNNYCSDLTLWHASKTGSGYANPSSFEFADDVYILSSWDGTATFHVDVTLNCRNLTIDMDIKNCVYCSRKLPKEKEGELFCSKRCKLLCSLKEE